MIRLNKSVSIICLAVILPMLLQGCFFGGGGNSGYDDGGELIGVQDREFWRPLIPYGMTLVPSGTFHMGQADEDITSSKINLNKQVTIGGFYMDDTEITNNEYRQFTNYYLVPLPDNSNDTVLTTYEELVDAKYYPDTTVWQTDFTYHMGDPMQQYYFMHPAFDDYPVVGVNWDAAKAFCEWRTSYLNAYRGDMDLFPLPNFRLPSEAEWEYASRGGRDMAKYPWGGPYLRNSKGCALANFKPGRGNYYDDGFQYTAPTMAYFANEYGLYDMAGNVAEWVEDAYAPNSFPVVWDLNPTYFDKSELRKVVRGGSWKDIMYYVETGTRTYEYQTKPRSYIGFRCVMTHLGRSSGYEF